MLDFKFWQGRYLAERNAKPKTQNAKSHVCAFCPKNFSDSMKFHVQTIRVGIRLLRGDE